MAQSVISKLDMVDPIHPGDFLRDAIDDLGLTVERLAAEFCVPFDMLNDVVMGVRPMTYDIALMCEVAMGIPAYILMNQQAEYDKLILQQNKPFMDRLRSIRKFVAAV